MRVPGKTVQTIALLLSIKSRRREGRQGRREGGGGGGGEEASRPLIVVPPPASLTNWERELDKKSHGMRGTVKHGTRQAKRAGRARGRRRRLRLATGRAAATRSFLAKLDLTYAILDTKRQNIKNPLSATARAGKRGCVTVALAFFHCMPVELPFLEISYPLSLIFAVLGCLLGLFDKVSRKRCQVDLSARSSGAVMRGACAMDLPALTPCCIKAEGASREGYPLY